MLPTPGTGAFTALVLTVVLMAGCGSSKSSTTSTTTAANPPATTTQATTPPAATTQATTPPAATTQEQQAPSAGTRAQRAAFAACMAKAGWHMTGNPAIDAAARVLGAQPGFQGIVFIADRHRHRVAVGLFASATQAENAELKAGFSVSGNGHSAVAPGAPLAWINYSGRTAVDKKVAACATVAAHA